MNNVKISKYLVFFTIGLFIFTSFVPRINSLNNNGISDEIDQQQDKYDGASTALLGTMLFAQSFKPSLGTLTRVELLMNKLGDLYGDSILSIRESLSGEDLTSVSKESLEINNDMEWIEFDFPDVKVNTGDLYYIVLKPDPDSDGGWGFNYISWAFGVEDPYPDGDPFEYYNESWSKGITGHSSADYTFRTYGTNTPPNTPHNLNPYNHEIGVDIDVNLSWICVDPDSGDTVTYDLYFGTTSPPIKIVSNQQVTYYHPGMLNTNTTYYWKIAAKDNHDASTTGPIWDFTTTNITNNPPDKPIITGKSSGRPDKVNQYMFVSTDPEVNDVYYWTDWGDNTTTGWIGPCYSGSEVSMYHIWSEKGDYTIKAKAKDKYGAESDWATLKVTMPKIKKISINLFLQWFYQCFLIFEKNTKLIE